MPKAELKRLGWNLKVKLEHKKFEVLSWAE
jgi:hypothetical protein